MVVSSLSGHYPQQKQVMLPINLMKSAKQVKVLLCPVVPPYPKELALFESLRASPDVLVIAA
jgi:hypothetical protein